MKKSTQYAYDLLVIGAGSGGLGCSRRAASHGAKVALLDFVKPSSQGTTWGVGGTCVNVGCIPKKLMHYAAGMGELREEIVNAGWDINTTGSHNWQGMVKFVNDHTIKLNGIYTRNLEKDGVDYINKLGKIIDPHTIQLTDSEGQVTETTAENIVISVGGRPIMPDLPGAKENCITSDDLFWLKESPGKTLVIGAGYIAMECGGFIQGLGNQVKIMVRSTPLRGFDSEMSTRIVDAMEHHGIEFLMKMSPTSFEKLENGKILAKWTCNESSQIFEEEFDTVLMAIGRKADIDNIGIESVGVETERNKIKVDKFYQTNVDSIFAVGDITVGSPQLTPVAIKEGRILAERLFGNKEIPAMDYDLIATTVFTPMEYSTVGLSEELALQR